MSKAEPSRRPLLTWRILPLAVVTTVVLWVLIRHLVGTDALWRVVSTLRWNLVAAAVGVFAVNVLLAVFRWQLILRALSYSVGFAKCAYVIVATWPLAVVIPARAGDVFRAAGIADQVPFYEGAGSVVAEKAFDVQSLCLLSIAGSLYHGLHVWAWVSGGILALEWAMLAIGLRFRGPIFRWRLLKRFEEKVTQLTFALEALFRAPLRLLGVLAASLSSWILASATVFLLLLAASANVGFGIVVALWPIAVFAGMLPVTVAGMGTRDAAFVLALRASSPTPVAEESVLAATLVFSAIATWLLVIGGLPFGIRLALRRP
jgi:glycosyltransferase 2 family protein